MNYRSHVQHMGKCCFRGVLAAKSTYRARCRRCPRHVKLQWPHIQATRGASKVSERMSSGLLSRRLFYHGVPEHVGSEGLLPESEEYGPPGGILGCFRCRRYQSNRGGAVQQWFRMRCRICSASNYGVRRADEDAVYLPSYS